PDGPYLTLSHFWGDASKVFNLETRNREELLQQIPALPRIVEDAIVATRRLGARYIWIDSLCIIQDDPQDWASESSSMADVYHNAMCNIAASASQDSNGGLNRDRGDIVIGAYVKASQDDETLLLIEENEGIEHEGQEGWVLQKRLLSPRILHFSRRQLVWEPLGDILGRYTLATLTYRSDTLPAHSGIVKYHQNITGVTYLAGICKGPGAVFSAHLGWRSMTPTPRPTAYRAPSRNWASTDKEIALRPKESPMGLH
ncbi:HET-domain-containing protein, partial [Parathielavia appendiculata]